MKVSRTTYVSDRARTLAAASSKQVMTKKDARELLYKEGLITKRGRVVALIKEQPKPKSA